MGWIPHPAPPHSRRRTPRHAQGSREAAGSLTPLSPSPSLRRGRGSGVQEVRELGPLQMVLRRRRGLAKTALRHHPHQRREQASDTARGLLQLVIDPRGVVLGIEGEPMPAAERRRHWHELHPPILLELTDLDLPIAEPFEPLAESCTRAEFAICHLHGAKNRRIPLRKRRDIGNGPKHICQRSSNRLRKPVRRHHAPQSLVAHRPSLSPPAVAASPDAAPSCSVIVRQPFERYAGPP